MVYVNEIDAPQIISIKISTLNPNLQFYLSLHF